MTLLSVTIASNTAFLAGSACSNPDGMAAVTNAIIWGNSHAGPNPRSAPKAQLDGAFVLDFSLVQDASSPTFDPLFLAPASGDFRLSAFSPAIDAGSSAAAGGMDADLDGHPRFEGTAIDLGAYENPAASPVEPVRIARHATAQFACDQTPSAAFSYVVGQDFAFAWRYRASTDWQIIRAGDGGPNGGSFDIQQASNPDGTLTSTLTLSNVSLAMDGYQVGLLGSGGFMTPPVSLTVSSPSVIYVNAAAITNSDGLSWASAFKDLPSALAVLDPCKRILWVAEGTYETEPNSPLVLPALRGGVQLFGGFSGTEASVTNRSANYQSAHPTILTVSASVPHATPVPVLKMDGEAGIFDAATILDGLTIQNGEVGIAFNRASPTLRHCIVQSNAAGGVRITDGSPRFIDCAFLANRAPSGGAVTVESPTQTSQPIFERCVFRGNSAAISGGAIASRFSQLTVVNCLLSGNSAGTASGAIDLFNSQASLVNNTIAANAADGLGLDPALLASGGLTIWGENANANIYNSILWQNSLAGDFSASSQVALNRSDSNWLNLLFCCVQGLPDGQAGNFDISDDPLFIALPPVGAGRTLAGDFHLHASSPAVDTGYDSMAETWDSDADGLPRIVRHADMGAFEFQGASLPPFRVAPSPLRSTTAFFPGVTQFPAPAAAGANLTYQWQVDRHDELGFVNVSNAPAYSGSTTAILSISIATPEFNGFDYRVVISDQGAHLSFLQVGRETWGGWS